MLQAELKPRAGGGGLAADGNRSHEVGGGGRAEGCSCNPEDGGAGHAETETEAQRMAEEARLKAATAAMRDIQRQLQRRL